MGYHMHKLVLKHDTRQRPDDVIHICVADILPGEIRFYIIFMYHYRTNLKYQMPVVCIEGPLNLAHCNARYHILDTGMHLE
jgi:hypothetical protein